MIFNGKAYGSMSPSNQDALAGGEQIGSYQVVRKLGQGGMGEVYEAVHQTLGRRAAIKVLRTPYAGDPKVVARFFNEARAVNLIDHPGIVQVYDFGQLEGGGAYLVMEYLNGESLGARLVRQGRIMQPAEAVRLGHLVADALSAVHGRGIVHRDLKPDNVMVVPDANMPGGERTRLLDFGIAKLHQAAGNVKTETAAVMGTPLFMSPEQCRGAGQIDDRTDVYALGVMLYLMLSGRPPLQGEGAGDIIAKHLYLQPESLGVVAPHVPAKLSSLVDRLLCKDRTQRPPMKEVAAELLALAQDMAALGVALTGDLPLIKPSAPLDLVQRPSSPGQMRFRRTIRRVNIALAAGLLIVSGGLPSNAAADDRQGPHRGRCRRHRQQRDSRPGHCQRRRQHRKRVDRKRRWDVRDPHDPQKLNHTCIRCDCRLGSERTPRSGRGQPRGRQCQHFSSGQGHAIPDSVCRIRWHNTSFYCRR